MSGERGPTTEELRARAVKHGTLHAYKNQGCRCDLCYQAVSDWLAARDPRRLTPQTGSGRRRGFRPSQQPLDKERSER